VPAVVRFHITIQSTAAVLTRVKCQVHNGAMKYGCARVSTDARNPALQLAALKNAGCQTVFKGERISGATTKRPALLIEDAGIFKFECGNRIVFGMDASREPSLSGMAKQSAETFLLEMLVVGENLG
jgi:Resolvase, N terminal domain